jgi:hypothetical protein
MANWAALCGPFLKHREARMNGQRTQPENPDAATGPGKAQDAAVDTEDRQNERDAARSENDKAGGNGDDAIEDAVLAGKPAGAARK